MTVSFVGWPTARYAKLRLIMSVSSGVSTNITLSPGSGTGLNDNNAAWVGGNNILTHTGSIGQKIIVDVFTYDTGNNLFFNYIGSFD